LGRFFLSPASRFFNFKNPRNPWRRVFWIGNFYESFLKTSPVQDRLTWAIGWSPIDSLSAGALLLDFQLTVLSRGAKERQQLSGALPSTFLSFLSKLLALFGN
jgi:hypothetical protein